MSTVAHQFQQTLHTQRLNMAKIAVGFLLVLVTCAFVSFTQGAQSISSDFHGSNGLEISGKDWWPRPKRPCQGKNEVFNRCVGTGCEEAKCWKPTIGPVCHYDCKHGCFCAKGFYRDYRGKCVSWNKCLKQIYPWYPGGQYSWLPYAEPVYTGIVPVAF
uniref:Putative similar to chymotrypsin-elastase inhibitor ixodidin n=1 Tax=Rhipicephalus pulchellus TaxID=72859 RepID=L7LQV1_RHIPC